MISISTRDKFKNSRFEIAKKHDTLTKFKHSRMLTNLDFKDQTIDSNEYEEITLHNPKLNCEQILQFIHDTSHTLSFKQFCEFDTIADLDLLKRFLADDFIFNLKLIDESNFTKFFIETLPLEDEKVNDSMFSIFTSLVSKCYQKDIPLIINECIPNLYNQYYMDIFIAICMNHYFDSSWEILYQHINYQDRPFEFLKASIGLLKHKIYPPNRDEFIINIISHPVIGIFRVLDMLNMERNEIQRFQIELSIIEALEKDDHRINSDALNFLSKKEHLFLLENDDIINLLFTMLEIGNFNQKKKIIVFLYDIIQSVPFNIMELFIEKGIIEACCDLFNDINLQIQYVCLRIILICITYEKKNLFENHMFVIERFNDEELYNAFYEFTESRDEKISQVSQQIINEITNKEEQLND